MEDSGTEGNAPVSGQWQNVAERVADVIRVSGIEVFRKAVRQVACERLKAHDEREQREKARREALKNDGVLYRDGSIPEQPGSDWFFCLKMIRGSIKLPPEIAPPPKQPERPSAPEWLDSKAREDWDDADEKEVDRYHKEKAKYDKRIRAFWPRWHRAILPLFEHVKQRGFPNDDNSDYLYEFQLCCWVPNKLDPAKDPRNEGLLPVPRRKLEPLEKIAVLSAVYDAHWRGSEKVAPWGLSEDGSEPEIWQADAERNERWAAFFYFSLFREAQQLDDSDLPVVGSWLDELDRRNSALRKHLGIEHSGEDAIAQEREHTVGTVSLWVNHALQAARSNNTRVQFSNADWFLFSGLLGRTTPWPNREACEAYCNHANTDTGPETFYKYWAGLNKAIAKLGIHVKNTRNIGYELKPGPKPKPKARKRRKRTANLTRN